MTRSIKLVNQIIDKHELLLPIGSTGDENSKKRQKVVYDDGVIDDPHAIIEIDALPMGYGEDN